MREGVTQILIKMNKPPNYISMESRGCTPELLFELYHNKTLTEREIREIFSIRDYKVLNRWFKESKITKRGNGRIYSFNKNFFDTIDTEYKAYWLGFVWCDGYICKRTRNQHITYEFKLDVSSQDKDHLYKFLNDIEGNYKIREYKCNGFNKESTVSRLYISNKYFASVLYEDYGFVPNRFDVKKLISKIPYEQIRHFIRGVIDAEGSIIDYYVQGINQKYYKNNLSISTYEELLNYIQEYFMLEGIIKKKVKLNKRHSDRDTYCKSMQFCGTNLVPSILDYLYEDANVYLERKYEKYISIKTKNGG